MKRSSRARCERSTSWLDELAIWSFEWCNIANIHEAARRALDKLARRALIEPASSCKRGITAIQISDVCRFRVKIKECDTFLAFTSCVLIKSTHQKMDIFHIQ